MNPYETLDVDAKSTIDTIKAAYKKMAKKFHPDRKGGDAKKMAEVNVAYALLADPVRRDRFDQTGETEGPPSIEVQAQNALAQVFDQLLSDDIDIDPSMDPVEHLTATFRDAIKRANFEVKKVETYLAKLEKKAGRIARTGSAGRSDIWGRVLSDRRARYKGTIQKNQMTIEVAKAAIELLKTDYEGKRVAQPTPPRTWSDLSSYTLGSK